MRGVGCEERREVWTLEVTTFHKVCRNHCLKVGVMVVIVRMMMKMTMAMMTMIMMEMMILSVPEGKSEEESVVVHGSG